MTIKRTMILLLSLIAICLIVAQADILQNAYRTYHNAERAQVANSALDGLGSSAAQWAMERGMTNAALNADSPAEKATLAKLNELRQQADSAYSSAVEDAATARLIIEPQYKESIQQAEQKLTTLRKAVDTQLTLPKTSRDAGMVAAWFPAASQHILETQKLRINLSSQAAALEARNSKDIMMRHGIWLMMEYAGRERGMLAGIIAKQSAIAPQAMQRLQEYRGRMDEGWNMVENIHLDAKEHAAYDGPLAEARKAFFTDFEPIRQRTYAEAEAGANYSISPAEWLAASTKAIDSIGAIKAANVKVEDAAFKADSRHALIKMIASAMFFALSLGVIGTAIFIIIKRVTGPVDILSNIMNRMSAGELNQQVPYTQRHDELGNIAQSVEVLRQAALEKERLQEEDRKAQAAKLARQQRMEVLIRNFEQMAAKAVATVAAAATQMNQTTTRMSGMISETSQKASNVSTASERTLQNVQTVAAATEEMTASIQEVAQRIHESTTAVNEAIQRADSADQAAMALSQASQEIDSIVNTIEDIAEQINMLALNATIESARAGEAGKGFAVVAGEVKTLASQTANATRSITSQITNIKAVAQQVVEVLGSIKGAIGMVNQYSTAIASTMEQQSSVTNEISASMQNASQGVQNISDNIVVVSHVAQGADSSTQEMLGAASELSQQAEKLNYEVNRFLDEIQAA